jgi:hypothetical protein
VVFDRLRAFAGKHHAGLFAALDGGRLLEIGEARLRIGVPAGFAAQRLGQKQGELEACCEQFFGRRVGVEIAPLGDAPSPPRAERASEAEAVRRLRQQALAHPAVNTALDVLDGEILEIRPLGGPR